MKSQNLPAVYQLKPGALLLAARIGCSEHFVRCSCECSGFCHVDYFSPDSHRRISDLDSTAFLSSESVEGDQSHDRWWEKTRESGRRDSQVLHCGRLEEQGGGSGENVFEVRNTKHSYVPYFNFCMTIRKKRCTKNFRNFEWSEMLA